MQIGSFATFVWLLCYVCWPYTAGPARVWHGWLPVEVDGATGKVTVEVEQQPVVIGKTVGFQAERLAFVIDAHQQQPAGVAGPALL